MEGSRSRSLQPKGAGPRFVIYMPAILEALRELGSSATTREVYDWIAERLDIPSDELEGTTKGGQSKFENKVGWARFYLAKAGLVDSEKLGVWVLTEAGREVRLDHSQALALFREIHERYRPARGQARRRKSASRPASAAELVEEEALDEAAADEGEESAPDERLYLNEDEKRAELIEILQGLSDSGFEELCARLLRHIGFEHVRVTGRAGDRGVDGEGQLTINRFVRTKVMFQCKRYTGSVGPEKIRDFRGAIQGRAERGVFLTTATFTRGAREEAGRENATPIELVDIDRLLDLLIEEQLGVRETRALVVDSAFFEPYS